MGHMVDGSIPDFRVWVMVDGSVYLTSMFGPHVDGGVYLASVFRSRWVAIYTWTALLDFECRLHGAGPGVPGW